MKYFAISHSDSCNKYYKSWFYGGIVFCIFIFIYLLIYIYVFKLLFIFYYSYMFIYYHIS